VPAVKVLSAEVSVSLKNAPVIAPPTAIAVNPIINKLIKIFVFIFSPK
jgi:hypothetical protein